MDIKYSESVSRGPGSLKLVGCYEPDTGSWQYDCIDEEKHQAALIDIVQKFDPAPATTKFDHAQWALDYFERENVNRHPLLPPFLECAPAGGHLRTEDFPHPGSSLRKSHDQETSAAQQR